jgi:hypothetical protein
VEVVVKVDVVTELAVAVSVIVVDVDTVTVVEASTGSEVIVIGSIVVDVCPTSQ